MVFTRVKIMIAVFAGLALLGVSACSSDSKETSKNLTGTAARGAALVGTVTVKDSTGKVKSTTTDSNGSFTLDVSDMSLPLIIKAEDSQGYAVFSAVNVIGNSNVTPVTTAIMAMALGYDPATIDMDDGVRVYLDFSAVEYAAGSMASLLKLIYENNTAMTQLLGGFDLLSGQFSADGSGFDGILDVVSFNIADIANFNLTITIAGVSMVIDVTDPADFDSLDFSSLQEAAENAEQMLTKRIVFISGVESFEGEDYIYTQSLWTMKVNGSDKQQVSLNLDGKEIGAALLTPDGTKIIYDMCTVQDTEPNPVDDPPASSEDDGIYIMNSDGTSSVQIVSMGYNPVISPDGTKLAYIQMGTGGQSIYVLDLENTGGSPVCAVDGTDSELNCARPAWSADGTTIFFAAVSMAMPVPPELPAVNYNIYCVSVVNEETGEWGEPVNMTNSATEYFMEPAPSPDGKYIAYSSGDNIVVGEIDDSGATLAITNPLDVTAELSEGDEQVYYFSNPCWHPDSTKLIVAGYLDTGEEPEVDPEAPEPPDSGDETESDYVYSIDLKATVPVLLNISSDIQGYIDSLTVQW